MKRGTLLFRQMPSRLLPSFADCGQHELGFLELMRRALRESAPRIAALEAAASRVRRLAGDLAVDGKGEILVCQH
jgi:formylmethanofuran dehydrogenase subunit C